MKKKQFEQKFSRHIGRIMNKFDSANNANNDNYQDVKDYTKAEMWLLCQDLIVMLGMNERDEVNENKKQSNNL